jgi:glycolate oxidase
VAAGAEILKVCAEVGGSISGEHGIGLEKMDYMPLVFSEADLDCMARVRRAFDPAGLSNPGKIFPTRRACAEAGIASRPHPLEAKGLAQRF